MKKPKLIPPTDEEDAAINAGIAADPDTYELSDAEFAELRPFRPEIQEDIEPGSGPDPAGIDH